MSTKKIVFGVSGKNNILLTTIGSELPFMVNGSFDDLKLYIKIKKRDVILVRDVNIGNNNVGITPGIYDIYCLKDALAISKSVELQDFSIPNDNYPLLTDLLRLYEVVFEQV